MSVNLLELVQGAAGNKQVLGQLGGLLGESEEKTGSLLGAAAPAILGGLMKKASSAHGPDEILKALEDNDDGILDNLGGLLGGDGHSSLMEKGMQIIGMLFGSQQNSLIATIAKMAGLGSNTKSATSMLGILAPIVMSVLGRQRKSGGLDASGVANLLMSQKDHLASVMPGELGSQLGLGNLLGAGADAVSSAAGGAADAASAVGGAASHATSEAASAGGGLLKMLLPLVILAGLGWYLFSIFGGGNGDPTVPKLEAPSLDVPDLSNLKSSLGDTFGNLATSIQGVQDEASAQAVLPQIQDATSKLEGLSLGSLPEAVKPGVGGMIKPLIEKLQTALETAYAIPGVRGILEPAMSKLMSTVEPFIG